ncbi:alpha/beta fold hydrolase [Actinomyces radicidentis]|uniref:Alpha/beta hydrolase n=1 Tax=Actinomyces radicidentis TaxID=111015 RepID=A0A0X8JE29_ACTRD|nr:alpha/beta hydrolase [Actinomyces radicidentis]AMD87144.1 alpha/beta hydrolase [Actinomyces radicidentis]
MPVIVNRPGPWTHRDVTAGGTRFHVALAGPESPLSQEVAADGGAPDRTPPLVVLLHGFPECWWSWHEVLPVLGDAGYRTAAVDLRGFGGSDRPPTGYDLVTLADDVAAVVRALGHERALVVGGGIGGQVAWTMAGTHAGMLNGIVPVGAPHPLAVRSLRGRALSGAAFQYLGFKTPVVAERRLRSSASVDRILRSWAGPRTKDLAAEPAGYYASLMDRPGAAHSALETMRRSMLSRTEIAALDRRVEVPVMAIQGELDPVQPAQAYARDTHHVAGPLAQVTVQGVGHFPQLEASEAFADALLPFLAENA